MTPWMEAGGPPLAVTAPGYGTATLSLSDADRERLRTTGRLSGVEIVLPPLVAVTGRVFGPDGRPHDGATVALVTDPLDRYPRGWGVHPGARTGPDGRFRLEDVSFSRRLWLVAYAKAEDPEEARARVGPLDLPVRPGDEARVDVRLEAVESVDVSVAIRGEATGLTLFVCGRDTRRAEPRQQVSGRTGPNRVELKDEDGKPRGAVRFDVPPGRRAYDVRVDVE